MEAKQIAWCIKQHNKVNHMYDNYLPYEFHLRMAANVAKQFQYLLDDTVDYHTGKKEFSSRGGYDESETLRSVCIAAVWGHDLIEDTHINFNDIVTHLESRAVAEVIYAVSNEKGRNRKERANAKYYEGIRRTKGAVFVKLCDRIANVQYSKLTKSKMFEMYKNENLEFGVSLGIADAPNHMYYPMYQYLINLFNSELTDFKN